MTSCANCNKESALICSRCRQARYCSKGCQRAHWKVHKRACSVKPCTADSNGLIERWFVCDPSRAIPRMCWGWRTELENAVVAADAAAVTRLLDSHARADVVEFAESRLLLHKAAGFGGGQGCAAIARLLIDMGASVDGINGIPADWERCRRDAGYAGSTPLYCASQEGLHEVSYFKHVFACLCFIYLILQVGVLLLTEGADHMAKNDAGLFPLFMACSSNSMPIVAAMLRTGNANVLARVPDGHSPLSLVRRCAADQSQYQPLLKLLTTAIPDGDVVPTSTLADVAAIKAEANGRFSDGDFEGARRLYQTALAQSSALGSDSDDVAAAAKLQVVLHSNLAEALLKLGRPHRALKECEYVLATLNVAHAKTRDRAARARMAVEEQRALGARVNDALAASQDEAARGAYGKAAEACDLAEAITVEKRDPVLQAGVLCRKAELLHWAGETERSLGCANAALKIVRHCRADRSLLNDGIDNEAAADLLALHSASAHLSLGRASLTRVGGAVGASEHAKAALHEYDARDLVAAAQRLAMHALLAESAFELGNWAAAEHYAGAALALAREALNDNDVPLEQAVEFLWSIVQDVCMISDGPALAALPPEFARAASAGQVLALGERLLSFTREACVAAAAPELSLRALRKQFNLLQCWRHSSAADTLHALIAELTAPPIARSFSDCTLCLEPLTVQDHADVVILECFHCYHRTCLDTALNKLGTTAHGACPRPSAMAAAQLLCPQCRQPAQATVVEKPKN